MICLDHIVLNVTANAVLWPEIGGQFKCGLFGEYVSNMSEIGQNGRLIANETDTFAGDQIELFIQEAFDAETNSLLSHISK